MSVPRMLTMFLLAVIASGALAATGADDLDLDVTTLPHFTIKATGDIAITCGERPWRVAAPSSLNEVPNGTGICLESKFISLAAPDRIKLDGVNAMLTVSDRAVYKRLSELKALQNVWIAGELRRAGKDIIIDVVHVYRQPPDLDKFAKGIRDAATVSACMENGYEIEKRAKECADFNERQKLEALKIQAFEKGLKLQKNSLKADDADGFINLAQQFKDLLHRNSEYRSLATRGLQINPDHPKAESIAHDLGLVRFENRWMPEDDARAVLAQREIDNNRNNAADRAAAEARQRALAKAVAQRPQRLNEFSLALRAADEKARLAAIEKFGDAVRTSPDAGFGREAIDILANLSDASAVSSGLAKAAQSDLAEVRKNVYEALAWRGRQSGAALDAVAVSLKAEHDPEAARCAVDSLVAVGGKPATAALIASLNGNDRTNDEIIEGLKTLTRQSLAGPGDWKKWWSKNRDNFDPQ